MTERSAQKQDVCVSSDLYASFSFQQFAEAVLHDGNSVFTEMQKIAVVITVLTQLLSSGRR